MKIYKLRFDVNHYENLLLCQDMPTSFYQMFNGARLKDSWPIPKVKRMEPEKNLDLGDAPGFVIPVFTKKALNILAPLIGKDVEILPLEFETTELYGVNVLAVLDAINYDLSEYVTFGDGKRILAFEKYVFREEIIGDRNIFKIIDEKRRNAFVTERFYNTVIENGLKGFKMKLVHEG